MVATVEIGWPASGASCTVMQTCALRGEIMFVTVNGARLFFDVDE
jgi:hypothetical protein